MIVAAAFWPSAGDARAHDLWIKPSISEHAPHERSTIVVVDLGLKVGHGDLALPVPFRSDDVVRFDMTTAWNRTDRDGTVSILGDEGQDPAGTLELDPARGSHWIVAYQSRPHPIALPGPRFEAYLREEGLEEIVRARAEAGRSAHPGLERFSRCAKTLLSIPDVLGSSAHAGSNRIDRPGMDRVLGLPLELVVQPIPDAGPCGSACTSESDGPVSGHPLTVQLLLRGDPLEGALVRLECTSGDEEIVKSRTGADGCVTFTPRTAGLWMFGSVHMEPSPPGTGARWDSLWASVTLTVLPSRDVRVPADGPALGAAFDEDAPVGKSAVDSLRGGPWR